MFVLTAKTLNLKRYSDVSSLWKRDHVQRWQAKVKEVMPGAFWAKLEAGEENRVHVHVLAPSDSPPCCPHRATTVYNYRGLIEYLHKSPAIPTLENCQHYKQAQDDAKAHGKRLPHLSFSKGLRESRASTVTGVITLENLASNLSSTVSCEIDSIFSGVPKSKSPSPAIDEADHDDQNNHKQHDLKDKSACSRAASVGLEVRVVDVVHRLKHPLEGAGCPDLLNVVGFGGHNHLGASLIARYVNVYRNALQTVHDPP